MAAKKPAKKTTKKASKVTSKRAAARNVVAARLGPAERARINRGLVPTEYQGLSKSELNQIRLKADLAYYNEREPTNTNRRTKGSLNHKTGVRVGDLEYDRASNTYHSKDGEIVLSARERNRIFVNPKAVLTYAPVHENGKIVAYRNSVSGELVTPYYRHQIYGKELRKVDTEAEVERSRAYSESLGLIKTTQRNRSFNLADSYRLLPENRELTRNEILSDQNFQNLVVELEGFSIQQHSFTTAYWELVKEELEQPVSAPVAEEQATTIREALGSNPEYISVLVRLGRRKPDDDFPVGDSDPNHIKTNVKPYYDSQVGDEDEDE